MQVKDVHAAARELPAQLSLEWMAYVVVDDDTERTIQASGTGLGALPDSRVGSWETGSRAF